LETYLINLQSGITINDFWVVPYFIKYNKHHAASLLIKNESRGVAGYPYLELLNAIENPDGDHSEGIRKLMEWSKASGVPLGFRSPELVTMREYDQVMYSIDSNQFWLDTFTEFRQSQQFKKLIRDNGVFTYWKEEGFPEGCRPIVEDDFECD